MAARIETLISSMTPEEKAGQLSLFADYDARGEDCWLEKVRAGAVGALFGGRGVEGGTRVQKAAVEESRLGIPVLFGADIVHGMHVIFPIPLAEAASFEPELAERTARAAALEATACGIHWTFAPMVDIARDQRWGRVAEGAGEDPVLGARFAAARVRGFHGSASLEAADCLLACPKHFAGYGAVAAGLDYSGADVSEATLRDVHLPPFTAAFEAGARTVMSAFNDVAGVPATGSRWLQTDVLRGSCGFSGLVVSDFTADQELVAHGFAADERDAARLALNAGVDLSMESGLYGQHVPSLLASGEVSNETLDEAVRRVLSVKGAAGLLDDPYRSLDSSREAWARHVPQHEALARTAARQSVVLLRNEGGVLPLQKSGQRIALIGPFASDVENLEGWAVLFPNKEREVSLDVGIRAAMADPEMLTVVKGSEIEGPLDGGIEEAVAAARAADVVLLAVGEPTCFHGEAQSRTQIVVPAAQQALVEAVAATGVRHVVLLKNGRALALAGAVRDATAILTTWFLGSQTGHAVADILFGDYSPSGRLPVSFPQDSGQQPFFYNRARTGRPVPAGESRDWRTQFREVTHEALYPFGFGLTYTAFEYSAPTLSVAELGWDDEVTVSARVRNTGSRAGEEVVQLYVHDKVASRVRPIRELKDFRKVWLEPGEFADVSFVLSRGVLAFHGAARGPAGPCSLSESSAEPGAFDVWVAPSSVAGEAVTFQLCSPLPSEA